MTSSHLSSLSMIVRVEVSLSVRHSSQVKRLRERLGEQRKTFFFAVGWRWT